MSYEIVMPRLGWNMEEGTLVEWLKQDGETVSQGETVCTIEGDKAATDIESLESGIMKIPVGSPQPGQTVPVGTVLGYIVSESEVETFETNPESAGGSGEETRTGTADQAESTGGTIADPISGTTPENLLPDGMAPASRRAGGEPAISPRARRAAKNAGVDWRLLKGSGRMGRVVEKDVLDAAGQQEEDVKSAPKG